MFKATTKSCTACQGILPLESFYRKRLDQKQSECIGCTRIRRAKWWKSPGGKASSANTKLKARFGINAEQYADMLEKQGGRCLICSATKSIQGRKLAVDHDHKTGLIRGLLCKSCNIGLGNMGDDPQRLRNAANYLEQFQNNH